MPGLSCTSPFKLFVIPFVAGMSYNELRIALPALQIPLKLFVIPFVAGVFVDPTYMLQESQ